MRVYDLAKPLGPSTPGGIFQMALTRRHGDTTHADGCSSALDLVVLGTHTGTHIDGLAHVSHNGRLHGGVDAIEASRGGSFTQLGAETIPPIVCRGVLLDVAGAYGQKALDASHRITDADLARTCDREGVMVRVGDAVLIRTGWGSPEIYESDAYGRYKPTPGPEESAAAWLAERKIVLTGADNKSYEWLPGVPDEVPAHRILLVEHGIYVIEYLDLEELARDKVYEFLFVAAGLRLVGATGAPLRPLAITFG
jgi:kynurenine formamidase